PPEVVQVLAGLAHARDLGIRVQDRADLLPDAGEPVAFGQFGGAFAVAGAYPVQGGVAFDVPAPGIGVLFGHHVSSLCVAALSLRGPVWRERTWGCGATVRVRAPRMSGVARALECLGCGAEGPLQCCCPRAAARAARRSREWALSCLAFTATRTAPTIAASPVKPAKKKGSMSCTLRRCRVSAIRRRGEIRSPPHGGRARSPGGPGIGPGRGE